MRPSKSLVFLLALSFTLAVFATAATIGLAFGQDEIRRKVQSLDWQAIKAEGAAFASGCHCSHPPAPPIVQMFLPGEPPFFGEAPVPDRRPVLVTNRVRGRQQVVRRTAPAQKRQQVARHPVRRRRVG